MVMMCFLEDLQRSVMATHLSNRCILLFLNMFSIEIYFSIIFLYINIFSFICVYIISPSYHLSSFKDTEVWKYFIDILWKQH